MTPTAHTGLKRITRLWPWLFAAVLSVVIALVIADPYVPREHVITTSDADIFHKYQEIVAASGYQYHTEAAPNGEQRVVIHRISQHNYRSIDCSFWRWESVRERQRGVLVLDRRPECAL